MTYFEQPTQIKFYDENREAYIGGIAYKDEIICGCCGGVTKIDNFLDSFDVRLPIHPIVPMDWINISYEIIGE